jgi:hypothetical protein
MEKIPNNENNSSKAKFRGNFVSFFWADFCIFWVDFCVFGGDINHDPLEYI